MTTESTGPFDLFTGLPVHPLVVHAVVVLVPIASLGLIAMAASRKFSQRFGILIVLAAVGASASAFVAKQAGLALAKRVGEPGHDHEQLGSLMPWFTLALAVGAVILWYLDQKSDAADADRRRLRAIAAVLCVVIAVGNIVWVVRVGDSGARSVWSGVSNLEPADDG